MTKWGDTHYCEPQERVSESVSRQGIKLIMKWYGWAIDFKKHQDDLQIDFCPWCGKKLPR